MRREPDTRPWGWERRSSNGSPGRTGPAYHQGDLGGGRRTVVRRGPPDPPGARDSSMFIGGISALLLQSLPPAGDGRGGRALRFTRVTRGGACSGRATSWPSLPSAGPPTRRTPSSGSGRSISGSPAPHRTAPVRGVRSAPADVGTHRRGGQLPAGPQPVRGAPGRGRAGRLRRGHGPDRLRARRSRPAPHGGADRTDRRLPGRAGQYRRGSRRGAFPAAQSAAPVMARPPYGLLAAAAVSLLPGWARWPLRLPHLPGAEAAVIRPAGRAMVQAIRWATAARPATEAS